MSDQKIREAQHFKRLEEMGRRQREMKRQAEAAVAKQGELGSWRYRPWGA